MSAQPRSSLHSSTLLPLVLALAVIISAVAVVQVKQHNRNLTTQLDDMQREHARLQLEWAQLQLEQATLAQQGRVDTLARSQFGMVDPQDYQIVAAPAVPAALAQGGQ
jgi:cell division protein FtsL